MVLNMEEIVKTPQFRSYWVQQNITEMKQYRAAVSDLYRDANGMREERVLLPEPGLAQNAAADVDLGQMAMLVPDGTVVYRAVARPTEDVALTALQEKVLEHGVGDYEDTSAAPVAELSAPQAGDASDFETHIDEMAVVTPAKQESLSPLKTVLHEASLEGLMTVDRNGAATNGVWTPFASAVVLWSARDWDTRAIEDAIQQTAGKRLTAGELGVAWKQKTAGGMTYSAMSDAYGLQMAVSGRFCVVADDGALLLDVMQRLQRAKMVQPRTAQQVLMLAGFDHSAARDAFAQWTAVVDGIRPAKSSVGKAPVPISVDGEAPPFWGKDMKSLSDAFAGLRTEQFVARHDGNVVRQTVTYAWQH